MHRIKRLLELGWRAVAEAHTALWVIEMIVAPTALPLHLWQVEEERDVMGSHPATGPSAAVPIWRDCRRTSARNTSYGHSRCSGCHMGG